MMVTIHSRIARVYRLSMLVSLTFMCIATIQMFLLPSAEPLQGVLNFHNIIQKLLSGNYMVTYSVGIMFLIFSPMLNLFVITLSYLKFKDRSSAAMAFVVFLVMILAMFVEL